MPQLYFYQIQKPWAQVILSNEGLFTAVSDYGNWGYKWSNFGEEDFRRFFLECDDYYLISKFCQGHKKEYDGEATLEYTKEQLKYYHEEGDLDNEKYQNELSLVSRCNDLISEMDFVDYWRKTSFDRIEDWAVYQFPSEARRFVERVVPEIKKYIKKELEVDG